VEVFTLKITGMSCGHCVGQVTKVLTQLEGVQVKAVRVGEATVAYDPTKVGPAGIAQAVSGAGYEAQPFGRVA
jgi:copper chaperone CopZ